VTIYGTFYADSTHDHLQIIQNTVSVTANLITIKKPISRNLLEFGQNKAFFLLMNIRNESQ